MNQGSGHCGMSASWVSSSLPDAIGSHPHWVHQRWFHHMEGSGDDVCVRGAQELQEADMLPYMEESISKDLVSFPLPGVHVPHP